MEKINLYVAVEQMKRITISGGTFSIKFRKWNRQTRDGGDMVILTAAQSVPLDRLMIETDSPYMAPVPHRGKRNDSGYVRHICERLADIKGVSFEECARITLENGKRFFGIG